MHQGAAKFKSSARNNSLGNASDRPPNSVGLRQQSLKFKRPPTSTNNQTQNHSANQSSMLRRVSSARNPNASVVESLQQFMASRSNSAARSSHGALSQNEDITEADNDNHRNGNSSRHQFKGSSNGNMNISNVKQRAAEGEGDQQSTGRASKYLKRDISGYSKLQNQSESQQEMPRKTKPPRAVSQNASKQVRFDIKEGLKDMIRDSAPAFDAAQIHRRLMDQKRQKQLQRQSADDLKLSTVSQNYSELQASRMGSGMVPGGASNNIKTSPQFGASITTNKKSTPLNRTITSVASNISSARRQQQQILSPKSSSSKKHAYNLALRYQKEVLESKVRKGKIDIAQLNTVEDPAMTYNACEEDESAEEQTPKSSRTLPPKPVQMTKIMSEVIHDDHDTKQPSAAVSKQQPVQNEQRQSNHQRGAGRKAGSIFRMRSESPHIQQIDRGLCSDDDHRSNNVTLDDERATTVGLDDQENKPINRTFYAGQIIKVPKGVSPNQTCRLAPQIVGSNINDRISIQNGQQQQSQNQQSRTVLSVPDYDQIDTGRSPSFAHQTHEQSQSAVNLHEHTRIASYVDTTVPISRQSSTQRLNQFGQFQGGTFNEQEQQQDYEHQEHYEQSDQQTQEGFYQNAITEEHQTSTVEFNSNNHEQFGMGFNNASDPELSQMSMQYQIDPSNDLFRCIWDSFAISEAEFLNRTSQICQQIERSKQALHEPLRQDEEDQMVSSAKLAEHGLRVPKKRLRLIRIHLRNILLDSFLPLIHEIIQLRDRLAYRKYTFKLAIRNQLKASIISDICSRLKQKIILKVLFLKSQFRKNLHSLFTAYYDLLVKKQIIRVTFDHVRTFKQRQMEKGAYQEYAREQLQGVRKVQVFDGMKRFGQIIKLQQEKQRQARSILSQRKLVRIIISWRVHMVQQRVKHISGEIVQKFRTMKQRHQLFAQWVNVHRVTHKIKARALSMINKQQDEQRQETALYIASDYQTESSTSSLQDQANGEIWLSQAKARSEEIFYRQIQELLLEREHLQTCIIRLNSKMQSSELNQVNPTAFDRSQPSSMLWQIPQSQALLSNKEQIYTMYPELQSQPLTAVPASLVTNVNKIGLPDGSNNHHSMSTNNIGLTKSVHELKLALEPPLHKFMVCPQPSHQTLQTQEQILGTKYSVHQALVAQQNLFGVKSTVNNTKKGIQQEQDLQNELTKINERKADGFFDTALTTMTQQDGNSFVQRLGSSNKTSIRVVPFKKQTNLQPVRPQNSINEKPPNQLFERLKKQNQEQQNSNAKGIIRKSQTHSGLNEQKSTILPPEIQLQAHIRNMICLLREYSDPSSSQSAMIRSKAMALAMKETTDGQQEDIDNKNSTLGSIEGGMSLTDFTQVAMQTGVSMLHLNDIQIKYRFIDLWRQKLVTRLLQKDFDTYRGYQAGRTALREWHSHIQRQKLKAVNHRRTKQIQSFYNLFTRWSKVNRQLVYETERQVRHFRMKFVLNFWRQHNKVCGHEKRQTKQALEFYIRSLHTKALASLCQNRKRISSCKNFERRQVLLKFFKRRWLPKARSRQLLRQVLERCQGRDEGQQRSRYQRQFELLQNALKKWKKRVEEKRMLYKTYMALNHYKLTLLYRHFNALKMAPQKTLAVNRLIQTILDLQRQSFDQMLKVCAVQNLRVREWRIQRQAYVCHRFVSHLKTMAVKTKIAKLFVQRKYLKALQTHVFRNNYVRPLAFREHQLRSRAFAVLRSTKGQKWRRQRMEIVFRAFDHRKNKALAAKYLALLHDNCLQAKKDRIIEGTVADFRKHTLLEKSFQVLNLYRMNSRKKTLLNQVAEEFHEERLNREIEGGRTQISLNTQTGCLLNANQHLLLKVMTEWKFMSKCLGRNKFKLDHKIKTKEQVLLLRCFLGWRSFVRYEQSELSQVEGGGTRSAISYLDVIDSDNRGSYFNTQEDNQSQHQQKSIQHIVKRYNNGAEGNKSSTNLSYVNTSDRGSAMRAPQTASCDEYEQRTGEIVHKIASESSLAVASYVNSSQINHKYSRGQFKNQQSRNGDRLNRDQDNSVSTLNNRAQPLRSSQKIGNSIVNQDQSSVATLSNPDDTSSFQNLNQRQQQSKFVDNHRHQHHQSLPDYSCNATPVQADDRFNPTMYQDTSELASGENKTVDEGTGSVESFQQHFGGAVGHGHNHGISAEETVLFPSGQLLSNEADEESKQTTHEEFTYNQLVQQHEKANKGEPALVTTLRPYNYEIDLPFKQNSSHLKNTNVVRHQKQPSSNGGMIQYHPKDYATFSIQETSDYTANQMDNNQQLLFDKVFSSSNNTSQASGVAAQVYHPTAAKHHFQSLAPDLVDRSGSSNAFREQVIEAGGEHRTLELEQQVKKHLASLTLSNQTGLHDELESIFRHNEEWKDEQEYREKVLREMASHYQTNLTTKDQHSVAAGSSIEERYPSASSAYHQTISNQNDPQIMINKNYGNENMGNDYHQDGFVVSESGADDDESSSQYTQESASFCEKRVNSGQKGQNFQNHQQQNYQPYRRNVHDVQEEDSEDAHD